MSWLKIPSRTRKYATILLDQQLWCFGCDIRRTAGNLLLEYGFERKRPPISQKGSSCYSLNWQGKQILLWGFGIFCNGSG